MKVVVMMNDLSLNDLETRICILLAPHRIRRHKMQAENEFKLEKNSEVKHIADYLLSVRFAWKEIDRIHLWMVNDERGQ